MRVAGRLEELDERISWRFRNAYCRAQRPLGATLTRATTAVPTAVLSRRNRIAFDRESLCSNRRRRHHRGGSTKGVVVDFGSLESTTWRWWTKQESKRSQRPIARQKTPTAYVPPGHASRFTFRAVKGRRLCAAPTRRCQTRRFIDPPSSAATPASPPAHGHPHAFGPQPFAGGRREAAQERASLFGHLPHHNTPAAPGCSATRSVPETQRHK